MGGSTSISSTRDNAVEGLRGLAALMVFYAHVVSISIPGWSAPPWLLWPVDASAAVMVFFVLSGYVIGLTNQTASTASSVRSYAWRRVVRLVPINTCAVFLTCALATSADWRTAVTNLFFLQSYSDYAGLWVPVLPNNANLWSLNHEVVFYGLFVVVWVGRVPLLATGAVSVVVLLLGWYTKIAPVFAACYAAGFLFWLAGLALAWRAKTRADERDNWPTCLVLALITWKLHGLQLLLSGFNMPYFAGPTVKLYYLDFLPVVAWLLATVARRTLPCPGVIKTVCVFIPVAGFAINFAHPGVLSRIDLAWMASAFALALLLWRWRPTLNFFRRFAPLGAISFALYATSRPIQEFVYQHDRTLPPNAFGFLLHAAVVCMLSFGVAWYLERRIQPALNGVLLRRKSRPPNVVGENSAG